MKLATGAIVDPAQLDRMLAYQNENVISRFTDMFTVEEKEAEDIFQETMKFMYLCQQPGIFITDDMLIIDEMWHNFILFTKEYHHFCQEHFDKYFHHLPSSKKEKETAAARAASDPEAARADYQEKLRFIMGEVYDHLGGDTVVKWFQVYPVQYSKANLLALRK